MARIKAWVLPTDTEVFLTWKSLVAYSYSDIVNFRVGSHKEWLPLVCTSITVVDLLGSENEVHIFHCS